MSETPEPPSSSQPAPPRAPEADVDPSVLLIRQGETFWEKLLVDDLFVGVGALSLVLGPILPWVSVKRTGFLESFGNGFSMSMYCGIAFLTGIFFVCVMVSTFDSKIRRGHAITFWVIGTLNCLLAVFDFLLHSAFSSVHVGWYFAISGAFLVGLAGLGLLLKTPVLLKKLGEIK